MIIWHKIAMLCGAFSLFVNSSSCEERLNHVPIGFILVENEEAKELLMRSNYAAYRKEFDLEVFGSEQGKLNVKLVSDRAKISPELKISMKGRNNRFTKPTKVIEALNGWILIYDYGEFGSEAWWVSSDFKTRKLLSENVNNVKVEKKDVAISFGAIHSAEGGILLVKKVNGKIMLREEAHFDWPVFDFSRNISKGILALTELGIRLKDSDGMTQVLIRDAGLEDGCRTLVLLDDGTIFLGGYLFLRKLSLHSEKVECYAPSADHLKKYRNFPTTLKLED